MRRIGSAAVLGVAALCAGAASGEQTVGYITIDGALPERAPMASPFPGADRTVTLREMVDAVDSAREDSRELSGLVLRLTSPELSLTQVEELGAALDRFRENGRRRVHLFAEGYGPKELLLGAHADEVIVQSGGVVDFPGLYAEEMFLADALKAVGVTPDFVQVGDYKGASEMLANSGPSPAWDQNYNALLDALYGNMRAELKKGRGMDSARLDGAMSKAFMADAETAIEVGLIDASMDRLDLDAHLEGVYGDDFAWAEDVDPAEDTGPDFESMGLFQAFSELMRMLSESSGELVRDTIAVVHIDGAIVDGESSRGGLLSGPSVGSLTIRKTLLELSEDPLVKGVIVRIDSPGGSATASENIWQGVRRLAAEKPVWTSVGGMAASGGYYIAVAGDRVFVNPSSIVGSIGVVGGKLALAGLYEKLHINVVPRTRGPVAGMMGGLTPWTEAERSLVRKRMTETYDLFASRVSAGRTGVDLTKVGEGRLFTGNGAIELKMADEIGGLRDAVASMADELGLADGAYDVVDLPPPPTLEEVLDGLLGGSVEANTALGAVRELVGASGWERIRVGLRALLELRREPVLVVEPRVLILR